MAQTLIFSTLSGKAVYSDIAIARAEVAIDISPTTRIFFIITFFIFVSIFLIASKSAPLRPLCDEMNV
jgi:hypothetical protein